MTGIRIRWAALGRVAAIAVAALALLQALPELLRPPQPPPLAADVGLPQPVPRFQKHVGRPKGTAHRALRREQVAVARRRRVSRAGTDVISSSPKRHPARSRAPKPAPEPVAAAPVLPVVPPPPPAPPAAAETEPATAPETPNDGSVEFAPR